MALLFLRNEHQRTIRQGKHLHEITFRPAGTAIRERQAQLVSQCPCLLLLVGFVYPVLVGFVGISGLSRHLGMDLDSNVELFCLKCFFFGIFLISDNFSTGNGRIDGSVCYNVSLLTTATVNCHGLPPFYTVPDGPGPRVREQRRAPCQTFRRGNPMTCKVVLHATAVL